jgi:hypothetical protein
LFQYLVSANPEASDCNSQCLLLCPSLGSRNGTCESQKSANTTFCWCYILNFLIYTWSSCLHHATVTSSLHHFC